jgi:hypothetical protein
MNHSARKRMDTKPPVPLEQFVFGDGQTLRSTDLDDYTKIGDARRWWHNRALHNAYGISRGLKVAPAALDLAQPERMMGVRVRAGIAYDSFGRMLYQQFDLDLPFPSDLPSSIAAAVLFLRRSDADADSCGCSPRRKCCLGEPVHQGDGLEFYWEETAQFRAEDGVPLARVLYRKGSRRASPALDEKFVAPRSRRFSRPHLAAGGTLPGATAWKLGPADLVRKDGTKILWQPVDVDVSTSAAGFSQTPQYFAKLSGPLFDPVRELVLPVVGPHIVNEFPEQFTFRFWIPVYSGRAIEEINAGAQASSPPGSVIGFAAFRQFAIRHKLRIVWIGCEASRLELPVERGKPVGKPSGCGTPPMPLKR